MQIQGGKQKRYPWCRSLCPSTITNDLLKPRSKALLTRLTTISSLCLSMTARPTVALGSSAHSKKIVYLGLSVASSWNNLILELLLPSIGGSPRRADHFSSGLHLMIWLN